MKNQLLALVALTLIATSASTQTVFIPNLWINEIHYNNVGTDTLEGFEIAGTSSTNLNCYKAYLYNGANGDPYDSMTLSGLVPDEGCGFGAVWFSLPANGIQNGPNDAIGLVYAPQATGCGINNVDTVLQFLSYQGVMTADTARLDGLTSTDIGVSESNSTPVGKSLQIVGSPVNGLASNTFYWCSAQNATPGTLNALQIFCGSSATPTFKFVPIAGTYLESAGTVHLGYVQLMDRNAPNTQVEIQLQIASTDFALSDDTIVISLCGSDTASVVVTIDDDGANEGNETHNLVLRNVTNGASIGSDSVFALTIVDNDAPIPTIQFDLASVTVNENGGSLNVDVNIYNPDNQTHDVDVTLGTGSATGGGVDFSFTPLTLSFAANSSTPQTVTIPINDDALVEGNEDLFLHLSDPTAGAILGVDSMMQVVVADNDIQQISMSPLNATASETNSGVSVTITLNIPSGATVTSTLMLDVANSTATNGSDFTFIDTTITWASGNSGPQIVDVPIINDGVIEGDETVSLYLANVSNGVVLMDTVYTLTITSEDTIVPSLCGDLFFSEYIEGSSNNKALEIFNPSALAVNLANYSILRMSNGGSIAPLALNGTIAARGVYVLTHNQASASLLAIADTATSYINFNGDDAVYLLNGSDTIDVIGDFNNYPGSNGWAVGSGSTKDHTLLRNYAIVNGEEVWNTSVTQWDVYPADMFDSLGSHSAANCITELPAIIDFANATLSVNEDVGTIWVHYTVSNNTPNNESFSINFVSSGSSASSAIDFSYNNQNVIGAPGIYVDSVPVTIIDDILSEGTETIHLQITDLGVNAVSTVSDITITIVDDDPISTFDLVETQKVLVWPNPVNEQLWIEGSHLIENVRVIGLSGNIMVDYTPYIASNRVLLDLNSLCSSLYIVEVQSNGRHTRSKIAKE